MKIKVCGMKYPKNIASLSLCGHDLTGLIFFEGSRRFVGDELSPTDLERYRPSLEFVGVFVNDSADSIKSVTERYGLNWVQLHGDETPDTCIQLRKTGLTVIKALPVATNNDISRCDDYEGSVDYFLFDTRTEKYGGSGVKFNWEVLHAYDRDVPFFLSGGIGPEDVNKVVEIKHPMLYGVDINSMFEMKPGLKDIELLKHFINGVKQYDGE